MAYNRLAKGLSPRLRGNPEEASATPETPGSIPAPAGEPPAFMPRSPSITVYPRACGEPLSPISKSVSEKVYPRACGGTISIGGNDVSDHGLSPRLRGNPMLSAIKAARCGSIPAPAGEPAIRQG